MWAAFHIAEDEKEHQESAKNMVELVLSFINPMMFKEYHRKMNSKEIKNEAFEAEIKSALGMTREQLYSRADQVGDHTQEDPDDPLSNLTIFEDAVHVGDG